MSIHLQLYCCTFYKDDISARASYLVSCAEAHDPARERGSGRLHLRSGLPARYQPQLPASAHHTRGHPPVPGLRSPVPLQLVRTAPTSELISYSPDATRLPESNCLGNWILAVCWEPRQLDSSSLLGASEGLRGQACAQTPGHADGALSSPCCNGSRCKPAGHYAQLPAWPGWLPHHAALRRHTHLSGAAVPGILKGLISWPAQVHLPDWHRVRAAAAHGALRAAWCRASETKGNVQSPT